MSCKHTYFPLIFPQLYFTQMTIDTHQTLKIVNFGEQKNKHALSTETSENLRKNKHKD